MPTTRSKQAKLEDVVDVEAADEDVKAQPKTSKKGAKTAKGSQKRAKKADAGAQDTGTTSGSEQDEPKTAAKGKGRGAANKSAKAKPGSKRKHEDTDVTAAAAAAEADTTEEPEAAADEAGGEAGSGKGQEQQEQEQQGGRGAAAPAGPGSEEGMEEGEGAEKGGKEAAAEPEGEQQAEKQQGEEAGQQKQEGKQEGKVSEGSAGGSSGSLPENVVEEGKVSFMFRPRVTTPGSDVDVNSVDDVQRLYLLLEPHQPPGGKCRLLVVPKKTLPDTKKHERFYAFVEVVGSSLSELTGGLGEHTYTTKTRGERLQPAAQPAGEGTYVIAKGGSKNGIHLGFKLSSPSQPGEVQDMLGIKEEGSFVLSAKNPDRGHGPNVPNAGPEADYSDEQREEFGGRAWIGVEDRSLLDVAGTELLLVGAKENPIQTGELGGAGKLLEEAAA